ncbi:flagellar basal-body MS-ring/collar protein FliF [Silanimonas sp.]|uniref:flagellar basal-body MS-ring/collar protein FliF n=1 Tax=Silanimonas sp. TaxID=1929290 RepID=UPI0022BAA17E|nr:flagellar basal-body MS-ring/collar protein FliF [Silanimonas sp.]MCZ8062208.1 flagellar basal-body MS-ring/collar protein FliF [Silanimonas sp.]
MNAVVVPQSPPSSPGLIAQIGQAGLMRQLWTMGLLTLAIAGGLWAFFWLQKPALVTVQSGIDAATAAEFADALRGAQIPVEINAATGDVQVPGERLQEARMALATAGLSGSDGPGMALIERDPGFGVSQFVETARYQRALESELAKTIKQLRPIREARVHLALPRPSAFTRQQQPAAASVVIGLLPGRFMKPDEVQAIQHLVANGIPNLTPDRVTVVDESGRLLTRDAPDSANAISAEQFALTREKESSLAAKVAGLIEPLVGVGRVRSEVAIDMDFATVEEAREIYTPESGQLRSEQVSEERRAEAADRGVPGATSNTPPGPDAAAPADPAADPAAGAADATAAADNAAPVDGGASEAASSRTRNFELDRTLTHTRQPVGRVKRITVAVVLDNVPNVPAPLAEGEEAPEGEPAPFRALSADEIGRIEALVKQAVGFNEQRGDVVTVVNAPFIAPEPLEEIAAPIWENPLVWQIGRIAIGALLVLLLIFLVIRPAMKQLLAVPVRNADENSPAYAADGTPLLPGSAGAAGQAALPPGAPGTALALPGQAGAGFAPPTSIEGKIEYARNAVKEDPRRVAQVVKEWMANDA